MLDDVTKRRINSLRQILVGKLPDPKSQVEQITIGLIYKFMNDMDMESIESLNTSLDKFKGTVFFVTHDREFVSSIATRILEIKKDKIIDFSGNYEDYVRSQEM